MVAGIQRYLLRATRKTAAASGPTAQKRQRLARLIGADGPRATPELSYLAAKPLARGSNYHIHAVRWRVFARVDAEGLLLEPRRPARATVVALPDADWTPERIAGLEGAHPPMPRAWPGAAAAWWYPHSSTAPVPTRDSPACA